MTNVFDGLRGAHVYTGGVLSVRVGSTLIEVKIVAIVCVGGEVLVTWICDQNVETLTAADHHFPNPFPIPLKTVFQERDGVLTYENKDSHIMLYPVGHDV